MNVSSLVLVLLAEAAGPLLVAGHLGLLARRAPDRAVVPLEGGGGHLPRVLTLVLLPGNVKYFCMNCTFLSTVAFLLFLLELQFSHHDLSIIQHFSLNPGLHFRRDTKPKHKMTKKLDRNAAASAIISRFEALDCNLRQLQANVI